ncbi:MAG: hypothetical protein ACETVN_00175 [Asgard group archaeon]
MKLLRVLFARVWMFFSLYFFECIRRYCWISCAYIDKILIIDNRYPLKI